MALSREFIPGVGLRFEEDEDDNEEEEKEKEFPMVVGSPGRRKK